jgi:chromosome partitioning protein
MKTIALSLQKGGTGKTSMAVTLAAELGREAGSAVVVDLDPQGNTSAWIGPDELKVELASVLFGKSRVGDVVVPTKSQGLSLIPTAGLGGELKLFAETKGLQEVYCIQDVVDDLAALGYKYCIFDLSPAFGALERAALIAADEVITPIMPNTFGVDGLEIFANNLSDLRKKMRSVKPDYKRIIITAIDNRIKQHGEIQKDIMDNIRGLHIYCLPVDQVFQRAQTLRLTIQDVGNGKKETLDEIKRLAKDIMEV